MQTKRNALQNILHLLEQENLDRLHNEEAEFGAFCSLFQ